MLGKTPQPGKTPANTPASNGAPQRPTGQNGQPGAGRTIYDVLDTPIKPGETQYWRSEYIFSDPATDNSGPASATIIRTADDMLVRLVVFADVAVTNEISSVLDICYFLGMERPTEQIWYRAEPDE